MNHIRSIVLILIVSTGSPSYGSPVICNDAKVFDESVTSEYFQLRKTNVGSYGSHFEIELTSEVEGSTLKDIVLFKKTGDEFEYFFNLKFILTGKTNTNASSDFTLGHKMIKGAELVALFESKNDFCTTIVRSYSAKI